MIAVAWLVGIGRRKALWVGAGLGLAAVLPVAYGARGPLWPAGDLAGALNLAVRLSVHYARHIVWPAGLAPEYPGLLDAARAAPSLQDALAGTALLAGAAYLLARPLATRSGSPGLTVALCWLGLVWLAVTLVVGAHEPGADRHAYPLLAALALASAVALGQIGRGRGPRATERVAGAVALCAAVVLACQARSQMGIWRDDFHLWRAAVERAPSSPRARVNLAAVLAARGRPGRARRQLERALALDPRYGPAHLGLAALACANGALKAGAFHLGEARRLGAAATDLEQVEADCRAVAEAGAGSSAAQRRTEGGRKGTAKRAASRWGARA